MRQGTRRMINAQAVPPYGPPTYRGGETAFFLLRPTCISVLPEDALAARVGALVTVFKSRPTPKAYPRKWSKIKEAKI